MHSGAMVVPSSPSSAPTLKTASAGPMVSGTSGNAFGAKTPLPNHIHQQISGSPTAIQASPPSQSGEEHPHVVHMTSQSMDSINTAGIGDAHDSSDVRTLFVSGLPMDTKSRELYLLFQGYEGYQSSTLKSAGKNGKLAAPVGFVTFETREQAEKALNDLQGVKFDPEGTQQMRLEFARSNTKVTKTKNLVNSLTSSASISGTPLAMSMPAVQTTLGLLPLSTAAAHYSVAASSPFGGATLLPHTYQAFDSNLLAANPHDSAWATSLGYDGALLAAGLIPTSALQQSLLQQSGYPHHGQAMFSNQGNTAATNAATLNAVQQAALLQALAMQAASNSVAVTAASQHHQTQQNSPSGGASRGPGNATGGGNHPGASFGYPLSGATGFSNVSNAGAFLKDFADPKNVLNF